ncbi:hypothetical protein CHF27_006050 [Romboutsia maritimum]|uniref:Uncharacterized protein n=1 Tax=Romboutsia maritimum TaxID=2020948 RepID=A0A371ITV6_9FIRM|nr:hypothetical protein [Romboutsia maritimum]RDY23913.1 hypothetical protein CHF27_006050 [Romboutsia maritimum]
MKTSNAKRTIPFKDKCKESGCVNSKYKGRLYNVLDNSHKVIAYPKFKKSDKFSFIKNNKTFIITISIVLGFILLAFINLLFPKNDIAINKIPAKFTSSEAVISGPEFSNYDTIVSSSLKSITKIDPNSEVRTESMHKNGGHVYAQGYFIVPNEGKIHFDMILNREQPRSLMINGSELIK